MKFNVGSMDRVIRVVLGVALLALMFFGHIGVWGWLGLVLVGSGLFRFCPLYAIFGLNTCSLDKHAH